MLDTVAADPASGRRLVASLPYRRGEVARAATDEMASTIDDVLRRRVPLSFRTADGTAKTSDKDYLAQTGTVTFASGETTKTITIVIQGDSKKEANETFYLDLFGNSSNSLFTKNRGIGTLLNDD